MLNRRAAQLRRPAAPVALIPASPVVSWALLRLRLVDAPACKCKL